MSIGDFDHFYGRSGYVLDAVTLAQIEAIRVQREADQKLACAQRCRLFPFRAQLLGMLEQGYEHVDLLVWLETYHGVVVHRTTLSRAVVRWKAEDVGKEDGDFMVEVV